MLHKNERTRARARRFPGQRLKKGMRRKLQQQFIDSFGQMGNTAAMEALGLSRFTLYAWLRSDPDFKARYDEKLETYKCDWEPMSDEEFVQAQQRFAMMPARDLMRLMRYTRSEDW